MLAIVALGWVSALLAGTTAIPMDTTYLALPQVSGQRVALHCMAPAEPTGRGVLFIHGSSFPTGLAAGFEFAPGDSWMHFMADRGFLACGLDFLGFGVSSRPPAMRDAAEHGPPVLRAQDAADDIGLAVAHMQSARGVRELHIVAHSWGTIPAATYAVQHAKTLKSLTLFGPVVPVASPAKEGSHGAWFSLTAQQRLTQLRFADVVPKDKHLLEAAVEQRWAAAYAASSPNVPGDAPDLIRIPEGPNVDIAAAMRGIYPYDAADIKVPVFVVYGNYDVIVDDAGASAFLARFTASPMKWRLRIDDGTHVMHLERNRRSLYESVNAFIQATEETLP